MLKNSNPCAVYQFLVKLMPANKYTYVKLPDCLSEILHDPKLQLYETFTSYYHTLSTKHDDILYVIIDALIQILNRQDDNERSKSTHITIATIGIDIIKGLVSYYSQKNFPITNSVTILAFNIFTDDQLDKICQYKDLPEELKQVAQDTKNLRLFVKDLPADKLEKIKNNKYSPVEFSELLCNTQYNAQVSINCTQHFQSSLESQALQILIEQELMIKNKN